MDDPEDDGGSNAPLLIPHSVKKKHFPKKLRPLRTLNWCLTSRLSMKKLFFCSVIVSLLLLGYLVCKSNWMFGNYSFQYSAPRLKPYAACVIHRTDLEKMTMWVSNKDSFANDSEATTMAATTTTTPPARKLIEKDSSSSFQHRRIVLIVSKTSYSSAFKSVSEILVANRIKYKLSVVGKNLPDLIKLSKGMGKYGVVVFEDFNSYLRMDTWNRELLDKYLVKYSIGILAFVQPSPSEDSFLFDATKKVRLPLQVSSEGRLRDLTVESNSPILRVTKGGRTLAEISEEKDWVTLRPDESKDENFPYRPVVWGYKTNFDKTGFKKDDDAKKITVLEDNGSADGIPKVLIGSGISKHWIHKLLFLDAISWLSQGSIQIPLTRYIQVSFSGNCTRLIKGWICIKIKRSNFLLAMVWTLDCV